MSSTATCCVAEACCAQSVLCVCASLVYGVCELCESVVGGSFEVALGGELDESVGVRLVGADVSEGGFHLLCRRWNLTRTAEGMDGGSSEAHTAQDEE